MLVPSPLGASRSLLAGTRSGCGHAGSMWRLARRPGTRPDFCSAATPGLANRPPTIELVNMKRLSDMKHLISILCALSVLCGLSAAGTSKPLKVFILAGQSNMEGDAKVETFDYIGDDPATAPLLKMMRGADEKAAVCEGAWISYFTGSGDKNGEGFGKLTAGFGSRRDPAQDGGKIGPEFTFGLTMDATLKEPVLIIKTAWGGKSLHTDFRPPSAGPYVPTAEEQKKWADKPEKAKEREAATGVYYRLMVEHVKKVLADPKRVCPAYDQKEGFEIAGFVWLQGWNDLVASDTYAPAPGSKVRN